MSSRQKRVVLITGASAGIGRATADGLTASGWTVIGASRRATGGNGWEGVPIDVDDDVSVEQAVAHLVDQHGRLDAVVAAAGWGLAGPIELTPLADAKAQFETNFGGSPGSYGPCCR
jgi:NAD(P)-dependent dehydrogenase (short-subunit alcohol dehydrogenase family)